MPHPLSAGNSAQNKHEPRPSSTLAARWVSAEAGTSSKRTQHHAARPRRQIALPRVEIIHAYPPVPRVDTSTCVRAAVLARPDYDYPPHVHGPASASRPLMLVYGPAAAPLAPSVNPCAPRTHAHCSHRPPRPRRLIQCRFVHRAPRVLVVDISLRCRGRYLMLPAMRICTARREISALHPTHASDSKSFPYPRTVSDTRPVDGGGGRQRAISRTRRLWTTEVQPHAHETARSAISTRCAQNRGLPPSCRIASQRRIARPESVLHG
ncbi:hypothetical protein MSAN_01138400 [Mycena sanguinolenta]|uniref:Uncharacterized protein n=1 Tax=Mycena sanguinolenta TaxID=230812 RepID=A0A8H7D4E7_9AGAR|nr:hypothetical protein MSAN_01138400 [Mycena sanguinolenta]